MNNGAKILIVACCTAGLGIFLFRKPAQGAQATISLRILDAQGNEVPHNSPYTFEEGESYQLVYTVTNRSIQKGLPAGCALTVGRAITTDQGDLVPISESTYAFNPDESTEYRVTFNTTNFGGASGLAEAWVSIPIGEPGGGTQLGYASEQVNVNLPLLTYAADVVLSIA